MIPARIVRALFVSATFLPATALAEIRAWTNNSGRSFRAEFLRVEGANAIFTLEGGRIFSTPVATLKESDQILLRSAPQTTVAPVPARLANFGHAWPKEIRMDGFSQSRVVSEDPKKGVYVYESPHYRFTCDVRLTSDVLRNFAMMFETTWKYATSVPLGLDGGNPRQGRLDVMLFETREAYVRSGGSPGSAACFIPREAVVLAPLESLGVTKTPTGFSLNTGGTNDVLIHELTHQLTPFAYLNPKLRNGWFIEGLAEYISTTPYSWGYFRPDPHGNAALAYAIAHGEDGKGGRALGKQVRAPRLRGFMQMEYAEFSGARANLHYGLGLMLTHYFLHMEGGGRSARITEYLKTIRAGRGPEAALSALLAGGSFEKLEAEFAEAWRRKGIEITFH